ncbi:MAG TPA: glutamate-1-semialdehyde-2,1-aminomutase [Verrucomicrobia bacterium]|nr:glutamate-1-semialdehyde-2,1-aminomutase [Verrucomicrobiota bacterium]
MSDDTHLFDRAQRVIPGGVNSPVRAFRAVNALPIHAATGSGSCITTEDGNSLLDFCGSWGPLILGHACPEVIEAVIQAARRGTTFGISTRAEVELAEQICRMIPCIEQVRLVSSGTEAVMTALRLARGSTGRQRLLKFDGCYHGHTDAMLVAAGSGLLTGGQNASAGIPSQTASDVFVAPYNDLAAVNTIVDAYGSELAAIIVEPVAANMGLVLPEHGFLQGLRDAANRCGAILIFDEVITGFRFGPTSWGTLNGILPDLTTLGKIVGGGMPLAAVGGRRDIMQHLAPIGKVYQAGTLSGNPVAVAAGLTTLRILERDNPYPCMAERAVTIAEGLNTMEAGVCCVQTASLFTPFFGRQTPPRNLDEVRQSSAIDFATFFRAMLKRGIYLPPSAFETAFVSAAHTDTDVGRFLQAAYESLKGD